MPNDFQNDYYAWANGSIDSGDQSLDQYNTVSVDDVINGFMISYVGEDKVIRKANRTEVAFFAQRGIQELSYDTLPSEKAYEFTVPNSLTWQLPKDYVNYTKIAKYDNTGLERILYPERKSSDPFSIKQETNGDPSFDLGTRGETGSGPDGVADMLSFSKNHEIIASCTITSIVNVSGSTQPIYTLSDFTFGSISDIVPGTNLLYNGNNEFYVAGQTPENIGVMQVINDVNDAAGTNPTIVLNAAPFASGEDEVITDTIHFVKYESDMWKSLQSGSTVNSNTSLSFDPTIDNDLLDINGRRYGINPERAQVNGSFYINNQQGRIHFNSNLVGEKVILKYISDSMGSGHEAKVHKFAEEALYKHVEYNLASVSSYVPQGVKAVLKKEARASKRNAKLRLSGYKMEEWTQILRNQGKHIKN